MTTQWIIAVAAIWAGLTLAATNSTLVNVPVWGLSGVQLAPYSSASYGAGSLFAAGATGDGQWTTTSSGFQVVRECKLAVPWNGQVLITANTSFGRSDGDYEARLRLGMDSTSGDENSKRRDDTNAENQNGKSCEEIWGAA